MYRCLDNTAGCARAMPGQPVSNTALQPVAARFYCVSYIYLQSSRHAGHRLTTCVHVQQNKAPPTWQGAPPWEGARSGCNLQHGSGRQHRGRQVQRHPHLLRKGRAASALLPHAALCPTHATLLLHRSGAAQPLCAQGLADPSARPASGGQGRIASRQGPNLTPQGVPCAPAARCA